MAMGAAMWDHLAEGDVEWYRKYSAHANEATSKAYDAKKDYQKALKILEEKRKDDERIAKSNIRGNGGLFF